MTNEISNLIRRKCKPCEGGTPPLSPEKIQEYLKELQGWELSGDGKEIVKNLMLKNFKTVLNLVHKIGERAEEEGHHPNLYIHGYKRLRIELATHAIGGLSENDFILAAKIDEIVGSQESGVRSS